MNESPSTEYAVVAGFGNLHIAVDESNCVVIARHNAAGAAEVLGTVTNVATLCQHLLNATAMVAERERAVTARTTASGSDV